MGRFDRKLKKRRGMEVQKGNKGMIDLEAVHGEVPCPYCNTTVKIMGMDVHNSHLMAVSKGKIMSHVTIACRQCQAVGKVNTESGAVTFHRVGDVTTDEG